MPKLITDDDGRLNVRMNRAELHACIAALARDASRTVSEAENADRIAAVKHLVPFYTRRFGMPPILAELAGTRQAGGEPAA